MAERSVILFRFLYSKCCRHFRDFSLGSRFITNSTGNADANDERTMFDFYQKNPKYLKEREDIQNQFDLKKQISVEKEKESRKAPVIEPENAIWTEGCRRVGAIGVKLGMMPLWLKNGQRVPVTLVQIKDCQVMATKIARQYGGNEDVTALEVGAVNLTKLDKVKKTEFGNFLKSGVNPKQRVSSFKVDESALLHPGTQILSGHFCPGQNVTVQAKSKDKGFQGVMKRWGMKGQPASHGQTKTHRKMGATGGGTDPGRIWPGKKMPGHMGNNNTTIYAVKVYRINTKYNVLYIHGQIPGPSGALIKVKDALGTHKTPPPFPTYLPHLHEPLPEEMFDESIHQFLDDSITFATES